MSCRAAGGREGIERIQSGHADLVMVDLRMPDVGGLDVLRAIRESNPNCQAVLMTGYAAVDTAVEAIKLGAMDYLSKPLDFGRLQQMLAGVRDELDRRRSVLSMERDLAKRLEFCGMIGRGPLMQDLFAMIRRLAPHVRTALVTGETGTGKELVARALHRIGPAPRPPLRHRELLGRGRVAVRERAVRARPRRLHRRHREQARAVRGGRRRHAVPRRDRRAAADRAGQAAARARARRGPPRRLAGAAPRQRARGGRDQPRSARRGGRGPLPERPLLPAQHRRGQAADAARTPRGHPVPDRRVRPRRRPSG